MSRSLSFLMLMVVLAFAPLRSEAQANRSPDAAPANGIVALLKAGHPVFGIFSGDKTKEQAIQTSEIDLADFVFYSMERGPFDLDQMQVYMQFLLEREEIAAAGSISNTLPPILRIPPIRDDEEAAKTRTSDALNVGVYGIVFPHVENAQQAQLAVSAMRFAEGGADGTRNGDVSNAARYWGLSDEGYRKKADVWPLDPAGELVSVVLIEDKVGIENARDIVSTPGVSVAIPGPGDLRRAYEGDDEAIEAAIQTVLAACKEFDVVCGITAGPEDVGSRLEQGFRFFIVVSEETLAVGHREGGR